MLSPSGRRETKSARGNPPHLNTDRSVKERPTPEHDTKPPAEASTSETHEGVNSVLGTAPCARRNVLGLGVVRFWSLGRVRVQLGRCRPVVSVDRADIERTARKDVRHAVARDAEPSAPVL